MPSPFSKLPILLALATLPILVLVPGPTQSKPTDFVKQASAPHIFGTIALPLKKTRFDHRWWRVLRARAAAGQLTPLLRTARRARNIEQLRLINASLNGRIRYRHDGHPSGDLWSTAAETLRRSAGDCEDYVIAKLQALRAVGVPERDLFMTIGHDGSASVVHAVLMRAREANSSSSTTA